MKHGLLDPDSRGQFAGHETFPLRLLWLKKAFDAVEGGAPSGTFQEQSAIARFGVGRNMAVSMRYWALASGFVEEADRVEEQRVSRQRLSTILRPEADKDDAAFAVGHFD